MIDVFLFGIVLGLIPISLAGLFVTAYLQYRRGDQLDLWKIEIISFLKMGRRTLAFFIRSKYNLDCSMSYRILAV